MLDLVEEHLPLGQDHWQNLATEYNSTYPQRARDYESLRNKFKSLFKVNKPTGDPNCPPQVARAKRLYRMIENRSAGLDMDDDGADDAEDAGVDADEDAVDAGGDAAENESGSEDEGLVFNGRNRYGGAPEAAYRYDADTAANIGDDTRVDCVPPAPTHGDNAGNAGILIHPGKVSFYFIFIC